MEVGVDGRALAGRTDRGVARYTRELLQALGSGHPEDRWHVLVPGDGAWLAPAPGHPNVDYVRRREPGRLLYGAGALSGRPRLDRLLGVRLDAFWAPAPAPLSVSRSLPLVVTVHDLSWEERPGDFTPYERTWHRAGRLRRQAHRAAGLVAVSHATKQELVERWGCEPASVTVVPPGVAIPREAAYRPFQADDPGQYLLFVGALEPRKGVVELATAYATARERGLRAALVVVGDGRLKDVIAAAGARILDRVDDARLWDLYAGATALVMPSHAEGFGLPALEAASVGTPSILSDLPSFAETLGDAALRVPAGDSGVLAEALLAIAKDPGLRNELGAGARTAAQAYTWQRSATGVRQAIAAAIG